MVISTAVADLQTSGVAVCTFDTWHIVNGSTIFCFKDALELGINEIGQGRNMLLNWTKWNILVFRLLSTLCVELLNCTTAMLRQNWIVYSYSVRWLSILQTVLNCNEICFFPRTVSKVIRVFHELQRVPLTCRTVAVAKHSDMLIASESASDSSA
jgi:hypothetical protein